MRRLFKLKICVLKGLNSRIVFWDDNNIPKRNQNRMFQVVLSPLTHTFILLHHVMIIKYTRDKPNTL